MIVNHHQVDFRTKKKRSNIFNISCLAIALCTASPLDPPPLSQFKQDYLRFWPTGDGKRKFFKINFSKVKIWFFFKLQDI